MLHRRALLTAAITGLAVRNARAAGAELVVSQFAETRDLASIDPMRSLDFTIPNSLIFDRLMRRDADGALTPNLAESWERPEPTLWRLRLRGDARFHDGTPLTAADTAATLNYALAPANNSLLRIQTQPLIRAEAPDARTLLLHTSVPTGLLPDLVAAVPTLQAQQLADPAAPFRTKPIGSGPWRLEDWRPGERVTFVATGQHWRLRDPGFARIVVRAVPEAATRVADLQSGGAGIASDIPLGLVARAGRGTARVVRQPGIRTQYLSFWFRPPFDNPLVRQAVYHAIDRQALRDAAWGDLAQTATGPVPTHMGGYRPAFPQSDTDPARSRALLQQAGQTLPVRIELDVPPTELIAAQVLQAQLAPAGFEVRINPMESPAALLDPKRLAALDRGRMFVITALDNHTHDAIRPYNAFYAPNGFLAGSLGYTPDPRMAAALDAYTRTEPGPAKQAASQAVLDIGKESAPIVFLAYPDLVYGVAATVDMPTTTLGHLDFQTLKPKA